MTQTFLSSLESLEKITGFHAHVYYDEQTKEQADFLRQKIAQTFGEATQLGRWHDNPIGPHPIGSYQVAFASEQFGVIVPWLMLNHGQSSILIHPSTKDDLVDHRDYALWLGEKLDLNLDFFQK
ncbi:MAG: DOPA 4,5-dioxygenase family protein [Crocosphaera sp.]